MRSLWRGTISFGLVTIPVKLYAATEDRDVHFRLLHRECKTPIRYRRWCPRCEREVEAGDLVRGYEHEPDRFVVIEEEDLESLPVAAARTVEILDFVRLEDIDPIYFLRTYFVEPGDGGAKAYALLRRALQATGRIGLARVALRGRSSLAAVRVYRQDCLCLETMRFPDEIRSHAGLQIPADEGYRDQELEMARLLISTLSTEFVPERLRDEYREALLERIREKVAGDQVYRVEAPEPTARVADLMEALRQSVRLAEAARGPASGVPAADGAGPRPAPPH
ncbi:non-homologous end joining protein Ku [Caldinitratiruptor microaerophilus]|uniref:Non-homologous end joining protein Ku n=1 Tax=Caldinitratiruptor microaerophilus TaxID=671077 RepID=A0AA35CIS2_9FIRM|nr:Ku protein [Caldinitratiruptor microaerophilus]BDG59970.1 non-homologous end joining protein Ku [Caldinitratiruptor microaerophilus]